MQCTTSRYSVIRFSSSQVEISDRNVKTQAKTLNLSLWNASGTGVQDCEDIQEVSLRIRRIVSLSLRYQHRVSVLYAFIQSSLHTPLLPVYNIVVGIMAMR